MTDRMGWGNGGVKRWNLQTHILFLVIYTIEEWDVTNNHGFYGFDEFCGVNGLCVCVAEKRDGMK